MDGKRFALCFFRRLWLFAAAGILGAAACAGLYLLVTVVLAGPPEYQVFSQYRIYFDSEKYGEIQDYYNAYTWGEIMKTDEVLDYVMEALPEGITKEQVKASVSVGAMNDVKIMPLSVTTQDPGLSETIAEAYVYGLDCFGRSIEGLDGMDCWLLEEAKEVPRGTKAGNAALLGLFLGAAAAFFGWLIFYCLDDSIYLEADFENRYGIPVLGILTKNGDASLEKELETALSLRLEGRECLYAANAARGWADGVPERAAGTSDRTTGTSGRAAGISGRLEGAPVRAAASPDRAQETSAGMTTLAEAWKRMNLEAELREAVWPFAKEEADQLRRSGVLLLLPWGRGSGRMAGRLAQSLQKLEVPVLGAVICGAKDSFLRAYYGAYYGKKGERA